MFGAAFLRIRQQAVVLRDCNEATLHVEIRCGAGKFQIFDRAIPIFPCPRPALQSSSASNRLSDNNSTLFQTERFWLYPWSAICPLARHPSDVRTDILRWTLFFARSIMRGTVVVAEIFKEARL